jgi:hypothetical protein
VVYPPFFLFASWHYLSALTYATETTDNGGTMSLTQSQFDVATNMTKSKFNTPQFARTGAGIRT